MTPLAQIVATFRASEGDYAHTLGPDWLQGRTVFGGMIAALANAAMRRSGVPDDRPLRALQVVYIGPNPAGEVSFRPAVQREGKAVTLVSCTSHAGGETTATIAAMYGLRRESILAIQPVPASLAVTPDEAHEVPLRPDAPSFTTHYRQRWARGARLFSYATDSHMSVYVNYRNEPVERLTEAHALALMDAIPSPALALLDKPSPASTLSWTLELLDHTFDFGVNEWWRLDAAVDAASDGYVTHTSHVINPAGRIAAISRQVVVVYA